MLNARGRSAAAHRAFGTIPDRLARLFRLLLDATGAARAGLLDSSPTTHVYLAPMEERTDSVRAIAPSGCVPLSRGGCRRIGIWALAHGSPCDGATGPIQRLFQLDRPFSVGGLVNRLTRPNRRGTDPYARWCGRGGAARLPPIPINGRLLYRHNHAERDREGNDQLTCRRGRKTGTLRRPLRRRTGAASG